MPTYGGPRQSLSTDEQYRPHRTRATVEPLPTTHAELQRASRSDPSGWNEGEVVGPRRRLSFTHLSLVGF
jgi:hypothetical protein